MAHLRERAILQNFLKSLKFWPVISVLGPRQCGKSTFLRELLPKRYSVSWVSLDKKADRKLANDNPELFLTRFEKRPLVIDEAHKAPDLFDELKAEVDEKRRPGQFILSGSVYFSKKIGIQESLTGRTSILRMDTLSLEETLAAKDFGLKEIHRYLKQGGMPGVCFTRSNEDEAEYWNQWIETTCHRDLKIFSQGRLSGDLAEEILEFTSKLEQPTLSELARVTGVDARRVKTHVDALENLFVLRRVLPSVQGIGKDIFLPFDCGMASRNGADLRRLWQIGFLSQTMSRAVFLGKKIKPARYYLTSRHSFIDFELEGKELHLFCDKPNPGRSEQMTVAAAHSANPQKSIYVHCATDSFGEVKADHSKWVSWSAGWKGI